MNVVRRDAEGGADLCSVLVCMCVYVCSFEMCMCVCVCVRKQRRLWSSHAAYALPIPHTKPPWPHLSADTSTQWVVGAGGGDGCVSSVVVRLAEVWEKLAK